jgi:hypothetical protein
MQHLQVAQLVAPTFGAPDYMMRVPAIFERDNLLAGCAFAFL